MQAIAQGRRPGGLPADEQIVYDFHLDLMVNRGVSDATWTRAVDAFGERGTVDLLGLTGYYSLFSMVMNAARTKVPPSASARLTSLTP